MNTNNTFINVEKINNKICAIFSNKDLINENTDYYNCVKDIIENEVVLKMKNYIQHGNTTCYQHCINVSYYSFLICKKLGLNKQNAARAGLLHDLFLYDWHTEKKTKKLFEKHGFTHPQIALSNATKIFNLNEVEEDIILKHMWPLTMALPKYKESFIIILVDKISCILEFMNYHFPLNISSTSKKYNK